MILRATDLEFAYGREPVLRGASLDVDEGELVGIVGPNGAGKSTLLACLYGAVRPRHGTVQLGSHDLRELPQRTIARSIGVVPQRCEVPFPVSVEAFVGLGRYAHESWLRGASDVDRRAVRASLERMQLADLAGRSVAELSGGEFRRALVAQALAQEPRVLLFDEPVQQLDVRHQLQVMEFARSFTRQGGTAGVVVLHELDLAARFCDRLVLLVGGRVMAVGPPAAVLTETNLRTAFGIGVEIHRSATTNLLHVVAIAPVTNADRPPAAPPSSET